jgi:hypothetical protein
MAPRSGASVLVRASANPKLRGVTATETNADLGERFSA